MLEKIGGRKFFFTILFIGVGFCIDMFTERGLSKNVLDLIVYLGGIFVFGNSVEHIAKATSAKKELTNKTDSVNIVDVSRNELDAVFTELNNKVLMSNSYSEAILDSLKITNDAVAKIVSSIK
jgi:hypothetical protein